jgi:hypothetical protein
LGLANTKPDTVRGNAGVETLYQKGRLLSGRKTVLHLLQEITRVFIQKNFLHTGHRQAKIAPVNNAPATMKAIQRSTSTGRLVTVNPGFLIDSNPTARKMHPRYH